jgi:hydrogenase maturation protease
VLIDAVEANRAPGTLASAHLSDTKFGFFATHNIPFRLVPELAEDLEETLVVGVQPESLEVGEGLSVTVEAAKRRVVGTIESLVRSEANGHL